jgi:hypothetical protein
MPEETRRMIVSAELIYFWSVDMVGQLALRCSLSK